MEILGKWAGNGLVKGSAWALLVFISIVLLGWWQLEAQIDKRIDGKQAPIVQKLSTVNETIIRLDHSVDELNRQQGEVVGELRAIRNHFRIPAPQDD